jgi:hypothetical protein
MPKHKRGHLREHHSKPGDRFPSGGMSPRTTPQEAQADKLAHIKAAIKQHQHQKGH